MKTLQKIFLFLFLFTTTSLVFGQNSRWYLQLGGGYLILNQIEQLGFEPKNPGVLAYVEMGKTYRPMSVGVSQSFFQNYGFYRYDIKQQIQSVYVKYSLNRFSDLLPYGLDPYVMLGATLTTNRFTTYEAGDLKTLEKATEEVTKKPGYTFGAGVQIGSRKLVLGLHYQYTPGQDIYTLADFEALPFATGSHMISLNVGLRFMAPQMNRGNRCPRFGGKGFIRF